MLTNLFRPWILARLLTGVSVTLLLLYAAYVGLKVLRHYRVGQTSEGQIALARRAELTTLVATVALYFGAAGLALTVLAADRLSQSVRGAMCAYGVFGESPLGFWPILTSAALAFFAALFITLHRLDVRMETPVLLRRKFEWILALVPLALLDLGVQIAFALNLDLSMVASCCSVSLDEGLASSQTAASALRPELSAVMAIALTLAAAITGHLARRRPSTAARRASGLLSLGAFSASVPYIVFFVAPHAYETPAHLCPFCLLHGDVLGVGWPLFGAVFAGLCLGASFFVVELYRTVEGAKEAANDLTRSLGKWTTITWATALVIGAVPIVRYIVLSGATLPLGGPI